MVEGTISTEIDYPTIQSDKNIKEHIGLFMAGGNAQ
jgi:hypothetical protein